MRLSWNEVRVRAARFAREWAGKGYEKGQTHTFYTELFAIFDVTLKRVASFEEPVKLLGAKRGFIDLFWKGVLLVEQKSAGRSLVKAKEQAFEYFPGLKEVELPRFILLSDFQTFELYDLVEGGNCNFTLADLPKKVEAFGFILGVQKRTYRDQDPVDIKAAELMGQVHDALKASGYDGHDLERFLVRVVFCLFADATGIFEPRGIFQALISERTNADGSDLGQWLAHLFEVLDTPISRRQRNLDEDLARFDYVNGELFRERLSFPSFDAKTRRKLLDACEFSWDAISPAIFGSLFQSVMGTKERRAQGAHYTTEKNILKVIQPLFLDELRQDFTRLKARRDTGRRKAIEAFQDKLKGLQFLDPACGCGNFLIITYREVRLLEIEVLIELFPARQLELDVAVLSKIDVDQFHGLELGEFPARIAEVALWMMDHIMNNMLGLEFGRSFTRIPLRKAPHIRHGDALETDWESVLPAARCSYVLGNPPFLGAKYQTDAQRAQVRRIAGLGGSGGTLDFVTAWFLKAGAYVHEGDAKIGFVATNSITQGEQVAQLWPLLFGRCGLEIAFAHRTFAWGSDARGKAHVHVVIIGLARRGQEPSVKRLFSYSDINGDPTESPHKALTAYLLDAGALANRHLVVREVSRPLCSVPPVVIGSKPIDGGHYILSAGERRVLLGSEPGATAYLRPFVGAIEYINGLERWILVLDGAPPSALRAMPAVRERIAAVRTFREASTSKPTRDMALTPTRFHVTVIPDRPFLVIPESSSERREYVPIGWLAPPVLPSNLVRVLLDADLWHFGVLTSRMHMAWLAHVGGRLKSDYRYSIGIVYNAFPWPDATETQKAKVRTLAQAVLDARTKHPEATLADLYDPDLMPKGLRQAHRALDAAVDKLYSTVAFASNRDRTEHLFGRYERMAAPLVASPAPSKRRRAA